MSGLDEQLILDFPKCPKCLSFEYWKGWLDEDVFGKSLCIFFNPKFYCDIKREKKMRRIAVYDGSIYPEDGYYGRYPILEEIKRSKNICCHNCSYKDSKIEERIKEIAERILKEIKMSELNE